MQCSTTKLLVLTHSPWLLRSFHGKWLIVLNHLGIALRQLVTALENCMIDALAHCGIASYARPDAPGVYVADDRGGHRKIGSLGIRVRRGCSYHGLSLNVAMDLSPYQRINPCGYQGLEMTQVQDLVAPGAMPTALELEASMQASLVAALGYRSQHRVAEPTAILEELKV